LTKVVQTPSQIYLVSYFTVDLYRLLVIPDFNT